MSSDDSSDTSPVIPTSEDYKTPTETDSDTPRTLAKKKNDKKSHKSDDLDDDLDNIEVEDELETESSDAKDLARQKHSTKHTDEDSEIHRHHHHHHKHTSGHDEVISVSSGGDFDSISQSARQAFKKVRDKISDSISDTVPVPAKATNEFGTRLGSFFGEQMNIGKPAQPLQVPPNIDMARFAQSFGNQQIGSEQFNLPQYGEQMMQPQNLGSAMMNGMPMMPAMEMNSLGSAVASQPYSNTMIPQPQQFPQMMPQVPPQMSMPTQMPMQSQQIPNIILQNSNPVLPQQVVPMMPQMQQGGSATKSKKYKLVDGNQQNFFF